MNRSPSKNIHTAKLKLKLKPKAPQNPQNSGKRTLFSAVKNEALFLVEWIAYHKVIGFDDFIIISNDCTDGTAELLDALDAAGEITHITQIIPEGGSPQRNAAHLVNEGNLLQDSEWVCWLDADEFLNIHAGDGHLDDLIATIEDKQGMLIHWRIFGDSGNDKFPGRFISPAFSKASKLASFSNADIKTLFRMSVGIKGLGEHGIHRPALVPKQFTPDDFVNSNGDAMNTSYPENLRWLDGSDRPANCRAEKPHGFQGAHKLAQINHYILRTPEHFLLKKERGRGWANNGHIAQNNRHNAGFYARTNKNVEEDTSILRFEEAVTLEIERLRDIPEVTRAEINARSSVTGELARLNDKLTKMKKDIEEVAKLEPTETILHGITLKLPHVSAKRVRKIFSQHKNILEFGSGGLTVVALESGVDRVISVESSKALADDLTTKLSPHYNEDRFWIYHADIGQTRRTGRPRNSKNFKNFYRYPIDIWDKLDGWHPDVVLINGHFRAACFLTTMLRITRPVTVLFFDYADQPNYHFVEEFAKPVEVAGGVALFEVEPMAFPVDKMTTIIGAYALID